MASSGPTSKSTIGRPGAIGFAIGAGMSLSTGTGLDLMETEAILEWDLGAPAPVTAGVATEDESGAAFDVASAA